ncbi:hypothetical protein LSH36_58g22018 [Paralvinella palmiformis]|uniref:SUEL-type lectin domain-containing protein n=1 Tax=Paralvinella palmiformis TaxID=53620 RepID=A0AAD9K6H2_9ANNE|nr:hypothetical protein LSH36_58g22018 [Paralvinella palmiformis]
MSNQRKVRSAAIGSADNKYELKKDSYKTSQPWILSYQMMCTVICGYLDASMLDYLENQDPGTESDRLLNICQLDHVTLECDIGHVIVLKSALYGRMEANHCIGSSHLGCFSDVLGWVDRWCSGRWKCFIDEGFQVHLENTNYDCPQYRDKYLQLSYQCIDVVEPMSPTCSDLELPAAILSATCGYISSHVTRETSCFRSPWVVVAPPDSSIVIDILDFSWTLNGQSCDRNYAHIFDIADETTTTLCRRNQRQHGPYIFDTTQIQIRIIPTPQGMEFLIRYAGDICCSSGYLTSSEELR